MKKRKHKRGIKKGTKYISGMSQQEFLLLCSKIKLNNNYEYTISRKINNY